MGTPVRCRTNCARTGLDDDIAGDTGRLKFSSMGVPWVRMGVMESWSPKMNSIGADCEVT